MNKLGKFAAACAVVLCGLYTLAARLPAEYQEVEYIQSSGSQWIDTGVVIKDNHELQFKYAMLSISAYKGPFGSYMDESHNATRVMANNGSATTLLVNFMTKASGGGTIFNNVTTKAGDVVEGWMNYNRAKFNVVEQDLKHTTVGTADTSTLKLLGRSGYATSIRLYYFRILEDGTVAHDYVPCYQRSDKTKAGLYDTAGKKFYPASGLVCGDDVFRGDRLLVVGSPCDYGVVSPDYGSTNGLAPGDSFVCTAPAVWTNAEETVAAICTGYKVYTNDVIYVKGAGNSFTYTHPDCESGAQLVWEWDNAYRVDVSVDGDGTVDFESRFVKPGSVVTVTAKPSPGKSSFYCWSGDVDSKSRFDNPLAFVMGEAPVALTASFRQYVYVKPKSKGGDDGHGGTSWDDALATIPAALAKCENPCVMLADGIYEITEAVAVTQAATICGNDADRSQVVLDGGSKNRILYTKNTEAFVHGVTFANGSSDGSACAGVEAHYAGAVFTAGGVISNCTFQAVKGAWNVQRGHFGRRCHHRLRGA